MKSFAELGIALGLEPPKEKIINKYEIVNKAVNDIVPSVLLEFSIESMKKSGEDCDRDFAHTSFSNNFCEIVFSTGLGAFEQPEFTYTNIEIFSIKDYNNPVLSLDGRKCTNKLGKQKHIDAYNYLINKFKLTFKTEF